MVSLSDFSPQDESAAAVSYFTSRWQQWAVFGHHDHHRGAVVLVKRHLMQECGTFKVVYLRKIMKNNLFSRCLLVYS